MIEEMRTDEGIGWPSYVDFLSSFAFVLILFIGCLLYLISGAAGDLYLRQRLATIQETLQVNGVGNVIENKTIVIPLKGKVSFASGQSELNMSSIEYLRKVGQQLGRISDYHRVIIKGYADKVPVRRDPVFGNWKLSADRAVGVLEFFYRCRDCGYGEDVRNKLSLSGEGDLDAKPTIVGNDEDRRVDVILDFRADQ